MADVGSSCESEYDCKPRNFCWKLKKDEESICLEKYSAPDNTEFLWDSERYPELNKDSVYAHGLYCQSGIALRKPDDQSIAMCVTIDKIGVQTGND